MDMRKERVSFMETVHQEVWTQLNDRGIDYSLSEITVHFIDMMKNPIIQKAVIKVFLEAFESSRELHISPNPYFSSGGTKC